MWTHSMRPDFFWKWGKCDQRGTDENLALFDLREKKEGRRGVPYKSSLGI